MSDVINALGIRRLFRRLEEDGATRTLGVGEEAIRRIDITREGETWIVIGDAESTVRGGLVHPDASVSWRGPSSDDSLPGVELLERPRPILEMLGPGNELVGMSVISWRPTRRATCKLDTFDANGAPQRFFLKLLRRRALEKARVVLESLETSASCRFVKPQATSSRHAAFLMQGAPGTSLHEILRTQPIPSTKKVFDIVLGLSRSHGHCETVADFEKEREATVVALMRAAVVRESLVPIAERISKLTARPWPRKSFVHGDLHDRQILLHGEQAAVIDCEGSRIGAPFIDAINLAEHVRLRALQWGRPELEEWAEELIDHWDIPMSDRHVCECLVRARLAGVYALRPKWWHIREELERRAIVAIERIAP